MRLVFIHGRSQQAKDPNELRLFWEAALSHGFRLAGLPWPNDIEVVLPFYGDRLDRLVEEVNSPLLGNVMVRGDRAASVADEFRGNLLAEMIRNYPGLDESQIREHYEGEPAERGLRNWNGVLAMLRVLAQTPLGAHALDQFTRDVFVYLTHYGVRTQIDSIVAEVTNVGDCIVIAHSLGTVIAYNVLFKRPAGGEIPLFVTLGSPLGIEAIRTRVEGPLRIPRHVKHWFNARDPRDVVALFPLDRSRFNVSPPIENSEFDNFSQDRHGIEGYLGHPDVARQIGQALRALG